MKKLLLGSVAIITLTTGAANAADLPLKAPPPPPAPVWFNAILAANNQVSLDFVETYINYGEFIPPANSGPLFDSEKGWVPGLSVTGSVMRDVGPIQNVYLWGRFSWIDGHTAYWSPALTNTDGATIYDWDFRLGKGFAVSQNAMLTPYFGIGTNSWNRLLTGPGGYREVYSHDYAGAGLLAQYSPAPRWVLSANGLVGGAFDSSMTSSLTPGGFPINPYTYTLGNKPVYMAGGSVDYAFTEHLHGNVGIDYVHFAYGQSPPSPIDGSLEPNSFTSYLTVSVGLGYSFGGAPTVTTRY